MKILTRFEQTAETWGRWQYTEGRASVEAKGEIGLYRLYFCKTSYLVFVLVVGTGGNV